MSFTFTLFHIILCFCRFEKVYLLLLSSVVIYVLLFLFCRHIISHIIRLSKDERVLNRPAFYVLPAVHIFTSYYLYVFVEMSNSAKTLYIPLWIISSFLEMTLIVTFKTLLTNLSQLNEIQDKNIKLETARNEIKTLSVEVMEALAHTIDAKDEYTKGHSIRVANYSRMIAQKLGLSEEECENIYYMGLLHDLGKIGVPNEIINSPDRLTDEEYSVIKTHPGLGFDILSEIKSRPDLATGAKWHHERYDGKGYPDGKSGEDIPLMARIIAVADSYDAMTSNRSYRHYLPQEKVIDELRKNEGTQFDPSIAECMIGIIKEDTEYKMHE
ncbi:MAG: HD-GYP domain-containing protein [Lachnospiraceae bacterium]|nr:HD-GYP domain-containing protein [Lachnospiraceae bacterium]